jgi:predicted enzyme related to lactoylglutathione lyase
MTIRQNPPIGAPIWVDLMSSDTERSTAFYADLFGWTAESAGEEFGGYVNFFLDGEHVAGMMANDPAQGMPDVWSVYLHAPDADAAVQAARDNGGEVFLDAQPVGSIGRFAVVADPSGAAVGLWEPAEHRGGVVATTNAPCHFELHTRDFRASLDFLTKVFHWNPTIAADSDEFRYAVLDIAAGENAGVMDAAAFLPDGVPSHWSVYFAVDDVDSAVARVEALGGSLVQAAEDTPYGRLASVADPTGTLFKFRGDNVG